MFADAAELALVAATDGVAHPPGFPLYLILAKLWLALPLGADVAWRLNLLSAVLGALALPVVYASVRLITGAEVRADWRACVGPASAALLFGFSCTFWRQATITEVYTLNLLLAALVLALAIRYLRHAQREAPRAGGAAWLGLAAGLGMANHLSLGLMLFGVAGLVVIAPRSDLSSLARDVAAGLVCFAAGLLLYALLPLRAAADPIFAWGDPRDLGSLWRHATGWQYQMNFRPTPATIGKQLAVFGGTALREVGLLPLLLLPLGVVELARSQRALAVGLALAFAAPLAYVLGYDIAEDQATYFLIPFLVGALAIGVAVDALLRRAAARGWQGRAAALLLLLALSPLLLNYTRADRSLETEARDYALDVLEGVGRDAIVLTRFWNLYAPTLYLQHLEGVRRDVDLVDLSLLQYTWYVDYLLREAPGLLSGQPARLDRYRELHARWERDTASLTLPERREAEQLFAALVDGIVREAWRRGRPVYATFESVVDIERRFRTDPEQAFLAVPEALPMRLLPRSHPYLHPLPEVSFRNRWTRESSDEVAAFVRNRYVEFWLQRGRYFEGRELWEAASHAYRSADAIPPGSDSAREALARLAARGR